MEREKRQYLAGAAAGLVNGLFGGGGGMPGGGEMPGGGMDFGGGEMPDMSSFGGRGGGGGGGGGFPGGM